jgi:hypothetical protein
MKAAAAPSAPRRGGTGGGDQRAAECRKYRNESQCLSQRSKHGVSPHGNNNLRSAISCITPDD